MFTADSARLLIIAPFFSGNVHAGNGVRSARLRIQFGQPRADLVIDLHTLRRRDGQRIRHGEIGLQQRVERHALDARGFDRQRRRAINDHLVAQRIIAGQHLQQHVPVGGAGGQAARGQIAGQTDLPQDQPRTWIDSTAIHHELRGFDMLAATGAGSMPTLA